MNVVTQLGRLTRTPEFNSGKSTNGDWSVARFTIAVDKGLSSNARQQAKQNGDPTAFFFDVVAFGDLVDFLKKADSEGNPYIDKGSLVGVTGRLEQNKYTNDQGVVISKVYIKADRIEYGPKGSVNNDNASSDPAGPSKPVNNQKKSAFEESDDTDNNSGEFDPFAFV